MNDFVTAWNTIDLEDTKKHMKTLI
jgi:hypothetical protein